MPNMLLEVSGELTPERMKRWSQSENTTQLWMLLVMEVKSDAVKSSLLGRKATINLDSILKSKDITLLTKVHLVKAVVFPVVMYRCESWTIKKAECQRIDAFELWCWKRLRIP